LKEEEIKMIKTIKDKLIVLLFAVTLAFVVSTAASNLIYAGGHIHITETALSESINISIESNSVLLP
jgi:hypothetical protein